LRSRHKGLAALQEDITPAEVWAACSRLQNGKAPSPLDGITHELLKHGGYALTVALTAFFSMEWELEVKSATSGVIKPMFKKGDRTAAQNYRPITLGSVIDKVYNTILNRRLTTFLEANAVLHEGQQGLCAKTLRFGM
jgi:hypothetical protein